MLMMMMNKNPKKLAKLDEYEGILVRRRKIFRNS
jgi:hypothetical protein